MLKDSSKMICNVWHDDSRADREETGQQGVFDKILSTPVLISPQDVEQIAKPEHSVRSPFPPL